MRCVSCGHQNPTGSQFCQKCGIRTTSGGSPAGGAVACARCGAGNPAGMRFCTQCGSSLDHAADAPGSAGTRPSNALPGGQGSDAQPSNDSPMMQAVAPAGVQPAPRGPICAKCKGMGDPGAAVCKLCGSRYADQVPGARPAAAAPPPGGGIPATPVQSQPAASAAGRPAGAPAARLVSILKDGSDGPVYTLEGDQIDVGRSEGDIVLSDDPYLSPRHARIRRQGSTFVIRDLDSVNGIYLRIRQPVELVDGAQVLIGQQVLRFEVLEETETPLGPASVRGVLVFGTPEVPRVARLVQYTTEGVGRDVHYLYRGETVLGRETGDIVFTDDPFLSRRHAAIRVERSSRKYTLTDMGSSNGTAIRVFGEHPLTPGDQVRLGRHLFRLETPDRPIVGPAAT